MTYPTDVEEFVANQLTTGRFSSRDEVLVQALRVFRELTDQHQELKRSIAASLKQEENGETTLFDPAEFIKEQRTRLGLDRSSRHSEVCP
jgi:putative addiction module CopG family antidote